MKITFKEEFELEYEDKKYNGFFLELTRKQIKKFEKDFKDSKDGDMLFKQRLMLSIESDDKDAIMAIGDEYNYKIIFDTIIKDISERKTGN